MSRDPLSRAAATRSAAARATAARYLPLAAAGVALGMHLAVGAVYALTLLLAPWWVGLLLAFWWLLLLLGGFALLARRTAAVLAVPVVGLLSWMALVGAGRAWFGWR